MEMWGRGNPLFVAYSGGVSVADPDLELRVGGGGFDILALSAIFPSVISSFLPKIRGGRAPRPPPLDPPLGIAVYSLFFGLVR